MIILIEVKVKGFDGVQHPFMIKFLKKLELEETCLSIIKNNI